jgi:hypothetical protein
VFVFDVTRSYNEAAIHSTLHFYCEICGSLDGDVIVVLSFNAVWIADVSRKYSNSIFRADHAVCSSEALVSTYKSIRRYTTEDEHRHLQSRENLTSQLPH